jgi:hypothetical protein
MRYQTFIVIVLLTCFSSPLFANFSVSARWSNRKNTNTQRTDPRLKYLHSRKTNHCIQANAGVCTLAEKPENPHTFRYENTIRAKEYERKNKIRPWL